MSILRKSTFVLAALLVSGVATTVLAEEKSSWLEIAQVTKKTEDQRIDSNKTVETPAAGWEKPIPLTVGIDYTLATDYIFRGINFSEYPGEGREKLNHQLTLSAEYDLGDWGRIGGSIWFEWFAGQKNMNRQGDDHHLQEVDYTVYYGFDLKEIGVSPEIGFIWYRFPRGSGDWKSTQEIYMNLAFDESVWLRAMGCNVQESIVNPYLLMAFDLDLAAGGSYYEMGMSHDFALADMGMGDTPFFKDLSVTPSWSMSWQHNWLNKMAIEGGNRRSNTTGTNNMVFGLDVTYDLKSALNLPDKFCGEMYVKGFMYYSQALNNKYLNDEFWGGLSVGYSW